MIPIDKKTNQKLKLFEAGLERNKSDNKSYLEWLTQKLGSLNNQIAETSYLKSHRPDLIGSTELHLAYCKSDLEVFHWLLSHGADYTLKNQNGLTALHLVLKSENKDRFCRFDWKGRLENSFINAILTAHIEQKQDANPCDPNGLSHFHGACMTNNVEAVEFFLDNDVSIHDGISTNSPYFPGYTPLHFAARHFSFEVVEVLLKRSANAFAKDAKGRTPLHLLLERNFEMANISSNDLQSPLRQERDLSWKITRVLLDSMPNKDAMMIDDLGLSFLHVTSAMADLSVVEQVLEKVTDINHCVNVESPAWAGYTALHFAAIFNIHILKLLLRRGADLQAKNAKGVTPLDLCLKRCTVEEIHSVLSLKVEWKDITFSDGKTKLLDFVSAMRSYEHFKKFLRKVTNNKVICLPNHSVLWHGFSPMHLVVLFARSIANNSNEQHEVAHDTFQMISALFEKNAKMITTQDTHGHTPLHLCFRLGKMKSVVDSLTTLYKKLDKPLDVVDEDNLSLLHIACACNDQDLVIKLLWDSNNSNLAYTGESIQGTIARGWTPLHVAVIQRQGTVFLNKTHNSKIVEVLLAHGANVNARDAHGITPVHLLAIPNQFSFTLIFHDRDVNCSIDYLLLSSPHLEAAVVADSGYSHLHVACSRGKRDFVRKLLDDGADVNGKIERLPRMYADFGNNSFNKDYAKYAANTPLHVALKSYLDDDVVEFLLENGADVFAKNSEGIPVLYEFLKHPIFAKMLRRDRDLQMRAERDIGLTMLHVACIANDASLVESLLNEGADVNARVSLDSPTWAGFTPLHCLLREFSYGREDKNDLLSLLVERGADVTLPNAKQRTPVHVIYKHYISQLYYFGVDQPTYEELIMLLRAQKDFTVNPTSTEGITHFHIACSVADVFTAEKFLKSGHVDIDQPIDFFFDNRHSFKHFPGAGCTPLHLAVLRKNNGRHGEEFVKFSSHLEMVDLLLRHGANVNAENAWGETPFHTAVRFELRESLVRSGANVSAKDAKGCTLIVNLVSNRPSSSDELTNLLRCGCPYNVFDAETEIGFMGLTLRSMPFATMQELMSMAHDNFPNLVKTDDYERTVIHNLVSTYQLNVSSSDYATLIEQMSRAECDVDAQDKFGKTALHFAVKFKNLRAISGLLLAGADINITDWNGQLAFAHQFQPCARCSLPTDAEDEQCEHYKVFKLLALQVKKLQLCGLDVHPMNEEIVATAFPSFSQINVNDQFIGELEDLKNIHIGSYPIALRNFMSEVGVVADYPTMSKVKQNAMHDFFLPGQSYRLFREKYTEVAGLLKLQYRKALDRSGLLPKAKISLNLLAGIPWPELCSCCILQFLTNSELQSMIAAGENIELNMGQ